MREWTERQSRPKGAAWACIAALCRGAAREDDEDDEDDEDAMEITVPCRAVQVSTAAPQPESSGWRPQIETGLILEGLFALALFLPHTLFGDGEKRYLELAQLLDGRGFSTDKYSLIGPLFSAPLCISARSSATPHGGWRAST